MLRSPFSRLDLALVGCLFLVSPFSVAFLPRCSANHRLPPLHESQPERKTTSRSRNRKITFADLPTKEAPIPSTGLIEETNSMPDLVPFLRRPKEPSVEVEQVAESDVEVVDSKVAAIGAVSLVIACLAALDQMGMSPQALVQHPKETLEAVEKTIESMGTLGAMYFGAIYVLAEVLAVPAFPLTASAGYLFGLPKGTAIVLTSASIAATISFVLARTIIRAPVRQMLESIPKLKKVDSAIGKEGFKLMLLLRLSPFLPFAASNYLYGASSIGFWPYFFGTLLGFAPGTAMIVYTGETGRELTMGAGDALPWYVYAGGFVVFAGFLKVLADVANGVVKDTLGDDDSD